MIAKIAVAAANFSIDKAYSYFVPPTMTLEPGIRVQVPFGRGNRDTEGIVLSLEEGSGEGLKAVAGALDKTPVLDQKSLQLAAFLRERYFCTFYDGARAMLPAGLWFRTREYYSLTQDRSWEAGNFRQKDAQLLLKALSDRNAEATGDQLRQVVADEEAFSRAISYLLRKKWIEGTRDFLPKARDRSEKIASLAVAGEEAMEFARSRPKNSHLQRSVLETLCAVGAVSAKELCYYTGATLATLTRLEKLGYLTLTDREVLRCNRLEPVAVDGPPVLNQEQQRAYEGLLAQLGREAPGSALLYGVTGSGKTAVYLRLIQSALEQGRSAVLLVPEIALTPQLLGLLAGHFGKTVAVLHSSLPTGERYDQWKRARSGQARVVVGTRSAVFAPCPNLGLLILDEEQEHSYKSENTPRYDAREVALWRGVKEGALVVMGSATPSVETMYRARQGKHQLYTLTQRYNGSRLPPVELVDMKEELRNGNDCALSQELLEAMEENAREGKQTILFLNRRGNSRALVCMKCAEAPECPGCDSRMTYHSANERLMCHYCGHSLRVPPKCPKCGGSWKRVGAGTQKIQQELKERMPELTVERMDADTVNATNTHEKILDHFQKEGISVLLGTQMVAKGLNLPNVTLVGVLDADLSLYSDSYRAAETTFNMLTQVVGRAGRGEHPGRAMIQTLSPEHRVLQLAAGQDYEGFYALEISLRQQLRLPPLGDLTQLTFSGLQEDRVLQGAVKFRDSLGHWMGQTEPEGTWSLLGPAPCPVPRINYHYRYRVTLRCAMDRQKRALIAHLLREFARDGANRGVFAFADVNGYD